MAQSVAKAPGEHKDQSSEPPNPCKAGCGNSLIPELLQDGETPGTPGLASLVSTAENNKETLITGKDWHPKLSSDVRTQARTQALEHTQNFSLFVFLRYYLLKLRSQKIYKKDPELMDVCSDRTCSLKSCNTGALNTDETDIWWFESKVTALEEGKCTKAEINLDRGVPFILRQGEVSAQIKAPMGHKYVHTCSHFY